MLLRVRSLTVGEKDEIRERLAAPGGDVPDVMQRTSRLLRELSHLTVVVQAPRPDSDVVEHLEFVQLREGQLLAVIAAASGQIQNKLVPIDVPVDPGRARPDQQLPERAGGRADAGAGAGPAARGDRERARGRTTSWSRARCSWPARRCRPRPPEVLVDGQSNLLAGKADLERAKLLLRTLEEKDLLVRLLDRTLARARDLRLHRGRGEPRRPDRRLGGGGALWAGRSAAGDDRRHRPVAHELLAVIPLVDFTAEMIGETLGKT